MTNRRTYLLFAFAIVLGIGATIFANKWIQSRLSVGSEPTLETTAVVVAALEIPFGERIEAAQLKTINWPTKTLPKGSFQNIADVQGKVALQKHYPDEVLLSNRVVNHNQGSTLSVIISPNNRAVTVRVNDVAGVAGFLLPGNHVDVLGTRRTGNSLARTTTVLENVKVLAVDQTASTEREQPVVVRAVTLEVSIADAETLVNATQIGSVQLALRNPNDDSEKPQPEPVQQVAKVKRRPVRSAYGNVTVIRGTSINSSKVRL